MKRWPSTGRWWKPERSVARPTLDTRPSTRWASRKAPATGTWTCRWTTIRWKPDWSLPANWKAPSTSVAPCNWSGAKASTSGSTASPSTTTTSSGYGYIQRSDGLPVTNEYLLSADYSIRSARNNIKSTVTLIIYESLIKNIWPAPFIRLNE